MKVLMIMSMLVLIGCNSRGNSRGNKVEHIKDEANDPLKFRCTEYGPSMFYLYRCENTEVICYRNSESLQCKFKGDK